MSDNDQKKIIQEQAQANQRIIQAVEQQQEGTFQHQAPVNERIKQMGPNERIQAKPQNTIPKVKQTKTKTNKKGDIMSYKPKRGRPTEIKRDITKTSQSGLREGLTRATFIIREDTLDRLKQRAYDDRKKLKDIVTEALDYYLDNNKTDNKFKQYAGVLLLAIGFIYAGLELVDRQPVQSVAVGILAFLLVETALQNKSK
jgi:hypothetical protein